MRDKDIYNLIDNFKSDEIDNEIETIRIGDTSYISDKALERVKDRVYKKIEIKPFRKCKRRVLLKRGIAAAIIISILGLGYVGPTKVWAQIKSIISYVPGIGIALEKSETEDIYVLKTPIRKDLEQKFVTIKNVIADKETVRITLQGNDKHGPVKNLALVDEKGNRHNGKCQMRGGGGADKETEYEWWNGVYLFKGEFSTVKNLIISIADYGNLEIPFSLEKAEIFEKLNEAEHTAEKNGIKISVIPSVQDKILKINYITTLIDKSKISVNQLYNEFPIKIGTAFLEDKEFNVYKKVNGHFIDKSGLADSNGLYFDLENSKEKKFKLKVPYVRYNNYDVDHKINVPIPESGEIAMDNIINIGGYKVDIEKVKRVNKDYISLLLNTNVHISNTENLIGIHIIRADQEEVNRSTLSNSNVSQDEIIRELEKYKVKPYYYLSRYNPYYHPFPEYIEEIFIPVEADKESIDLNLISLEFVKNGPWEFDINVK